MIRKWPDAPSPHTRLGLLLGPTGHAAANSEPAVKPTDDRNWLEAHAQEAPGSGHTLLLPSQGSLLAVVTDGAVDVAAAFLTVAMSSLANLQAGLDNTSVSTFIEGPKIWVRAEKRLTVSKAGADLHAYCGGNEVGGLVAP